MTQPQSQLLSLYISVLIPILSDWIKSEDLCCLDTAVCSHEQRHSFLKLLEHCRTVGVDVSRIIDSCKGLESWILRRGLRSKNYFIEDVVNPEAAKLYQGKHLLSLVSSDCFLLFKFIQLTNATSDAVRLHCRSGRCLYASCKLAPIVTDLVLDERIYAYDWQVDILHSFIFNSSRLQTISNCRLGRLMKTRFAHSCDLKRTSIDDRSAVCLGGKYFNLTGLHSRGAFSEEDCAMLLPLAKHLTKSNFEWRNYCLYQVMAQCRLLTSVSIRFTGWYLTSVLSQLELCPLLKVCQLFNIDSRVFVESVIRVLSLHCRLLEVIEIDGYIDKVRNFRPSLKPWPKLVKFAYRDPAPVGVVLECCVRRGMALKVHFACCKSVLAALLQHAGSRLQKLEVRKFIPSEQDSLNALLASQPQLTSLSIACTIVGTKIDLTGISSLRRLVSLTLEYCDAEALIEVLPFIPMLRSLALLLCGVNGSLLNAIGSVCPTLIHLNLSSNKSVNDDDVDALLKRCPNLLHIELKQCTSITAGIFNVIKASNVMYLDVTDTGISKKEIKAVECNSCQVIYNFKADKI